MLIMSIMANNEENNSEITINMEHIPFFGLVTNNKVLDIFAQETAKKILYPKPHLRSIVGGKNA